MTQISAAARRLLKNQDLSPSAISGALSKICRFSGRTHNFYSVAQHSLLVAEIAAARCENEEVMALARLWGMLHDAHEVIIGDIPSPVITALDAQIGLPNYKHPMKDTLGALKNELDAEILQRLGIPFIPEQIPKLVADADWIATSTEIRDIAMIGPPPKEMPRPWPRRITPMRCDLAENTFGAALREAIERVNFHSRRRQSGYRHDQK